jgi:tripartite-type tricarboxylate transporter receptor subunit TctC
MIAIRFMSFRRRTFLAAMAAASAVAAQAQGSAADYPSRPIKLLVPFSAGSATDQLARAVGQAVSEATRQPVVVENKAGAAGLLAVQSVATAPPDGYTLLVGGTTTHVANPSLFKNLPYDPHKSFTPITMLGTGWQVLVVDPKLPIQSVSDLIKYATAKPGELNYASGSSGSRVGSEAFLQKTGLQMTHVPFKGNPQAIAEVISGRVQMMVVDTGTAIPLIRAGKVRVLAVTNTQRSPLLPDVPSIGDTVKGYDISNWFGLWAPAAVSPDLAKRINDIFSAAAKSSTARDAFYTPSGTAVKVTTAKELVEYQTRDAAVWDRIIKAAGIEPE